MFSVKNGKHFETGQWVDFARGLVSSEDREKMQAHLDAGCANCRELAGFFSNVALRAKADAYEVPEYALRYARAIYSSQQPKKVRLLPRMIARLVYDSFREPLLAGVRGQQCVAHQVMYTAGSYCVDLRLERERGSPQVRLIGQIADRDRGGVSVADVPVLMLSRNSVIARAVSNKFGEFVMEYEPRSGLRLYAPFLGEKQGIEIRLDRASANGQ